ncbi:efflux RND transporter periplasmic adaptor subunit [Dokdonella sp.]|uniref:efflux RND transporter periplasmic adaptor subunit n=1 Tax=Dokdonella sp. TaxID=2291710 RepID=UPI0027BAD755|nr:efflux RND transporter periplasmic adaptor subunit [Dokdonella sp.]
MDQSQLLKELRIDRSAPTATGASRGRWIALAVGVALLVAAGGWWLLRGTRALVVETAVATAPQAGGAASMAVLQATGYVTARRQATVSAQITGTLTQVLIEEGERVAAGQVLATLEDAAQKAMLAQAQAGLRAAQAQHEQARAQLAQNERDERRATELLGRQLVSRQAVELARTQVASQRALVQAQARQVEVAQANVNAAQVQLDYCTVRAPFAGVITAKAAQVGEIVSPLSAGGGFTRTGVGTIVDMDSLEIEVDVNEAYIQRVVAGQPVEAVLDAYPDWKIPAHVIAIIPAADRGKATVKVRIGFNEKDARIVPDMGVRVSFLEDDKDGAGAAPPPSGVLVPTDAIVQRDGRSVVFVVEDGRVRQRAVTPGRAQADQRLVEGVAAGTRVVRKPGADLGDGARVEAARK